MKNKPIFFISKTNRRLDYRTETTIFKDSAGNFFVEKRPSSIKARKHLDKMLETYSTLMRNKLLIQKTDVVRPTKTTTGLSFDFIEGVSVDRRMFDYLIKGDVEALVNKFNDLFDIINSFNIVIVNPTKNSNYLTVFGDAYNRKMECIDTGLIDLNFDNFIIDKENRWHYFDYEWCFDFPLPLDYVKSRALWFFFTRHQESLKYSAAKFECIDIGDGFTIPSLLYDNFKNYVDEFDSVTNTESMFQKYVSNSFKISSDIIKNPKKVEYKSEEQGFLKIIRDSNANKAKYYTKIIDKEKKENRRLIRLIDELRNSKSYKLANKVNNVRHKITPKKRI